MALSYDGRHAFTAGGRDRSVAQWEINLRCVTGREAWPRRKVSRAGPFFPLSNSRQALNPGTCQALCRGCRYKAATGSCLLAAPCDVHSCERGDRSLFL